MAAAAALNMGQRMASWPSSQPVRQATKARARPRAEGAGGRRARPWWGAGRGRRGGREASLVVVVAVAVVVLLLLLLLGQCQ